MKKFSRQNSGIAPTANLNLDFGAAAAKVARIFEPGEYRLQIESARVVQSGENTSVALEIVAAEDGARVDIPPLWVDGPRAGAGRFTDENQNVIAKLLTLAGQPTAGDVYDLIPKLAGVEFDGRLVLDIDRRSGRTHNKIVDVYIDGA